MTGVHIINLIFLMLHKVKRNVGKIRYEERFDQKLQQVLHVAIYTDAAFYLVKIIKKYFGIGILFFHDVQK